MKYPYVGPHVSDTIGGAYNKNSGARIVENMCATYVSVAFDEGLLLGFATGIEAAACELGAEGEYCQRIGENARAHELYSQAAHLRRQLAEIGR